MGGDVGKMLAKHPSEAKTDTLSPPRTSISDAEFHELEVVLGKAAADRLYGSLPRVNPTEG
jgi:hypothetical protein